MNMFNYAYIEFSAQSIKRFLLLISIIFCVNPQSRAQDAPLKLMPFYLDHDVITKYIDSLNRIKVDTFIAVLTNKNKENFTYFVWVKNGCMNVTRITDSMISSPKIGQQHFIQEMNMRVLAIRESESKLKFKPPVDPAQCDIVFVYIGNKSYIVEEGSHSDYQLNSSKNKRRSNFIKTIKSDIDLL